MLGSAFAEVRLGHREAADHALGELEQNYAAGLAYQIAEIHAWRNEKDQAFAWLQRAYDQHDGGLSMIKYDPFLASLRDDPRLAAMVRKMGLPE